MEEEGRIDVSTASAPSSLAVPVSAAVHPSASTVDPSKVSSVAGIININVGVLGHVDSGKTSLVKALSTSLSTAALDKNPQSQQRGITLDLGFSSFMVPMPDYLVMEARAQTGQEDCRLQFTLVDCPGHASLIRTIIGGAQIIDMMVLVIDVNKGIQTQTAECVVIGEITTDKLIIVLNKVDLIPAEIREQKIERMKGRLTKVFSTSRFRDAPIVCVSAAIGGEKVASVGPSISSSTSGSSGSKSGSKQQTGQSAAAAAAAARSAIRSEGISSLIDTLCKQIEHLPKRNIGAPFYFAVDHCFPIKGHGTVLTGTVLSGSVSVHSTIEIPNLHEQKKVKSMQMFHKPVQFAKQGDRVGICVAGLNPESIERGIVAQPGSVPLLSSVICLVRKVRFFRQACKSKQKFHISVGHSTVVATCTFFGAKELLSHGAILPDTTASGGAAKTGTSPSFLASSNRSLLDEPFPWNWDFEYQDELVENGIESNSRTSTSLGSTELSTFEEGVSTQKSAASSKFGEETLNYVLLEFQNPVYCPLSSLIIGSRLELDANESVVTSTNCRIAFFGKIVSAASAIDTDKLKLFKWKTREAEILRLSDVKKENGLCTEAIGWKLFSKEAGIGRYLNMKLETPNGDVVGFVQSPFGSTGKFKIRFPLGVYGLKSGSKLVLKYKVYVFDKSKKMNQDSDRGYTPMEQRAISSNPFPLDKDTLTTATLEPLIDTDEAQSKGFVETDRLSDDEAEPKQDENVPLHDIAAELNAVEEEPTCPACVLVDDPVTLRDTAQSAQIPTQPEDSSVVGNIFSPPVISSLTTARSGIIESMKASTEDPSRCTCIVSGAFKVHENIRNHAGASVLGPNGKVGVLIGPFAKMGKCKVEFDSSAGLSQGAIVYVNIT